MDLQVFILVKLNSRDLLDFSSWLNLALHFFIIFSLVSIVFIYYFLIK